VYEAGAVPGLVRLLPEGTALGKQYTAGMLKSLANNAVCLAGMKQADVGRGVAW